jgi:hypothetical protein
VFKTKVTVAIVALIVTIGCGVSKNGGTVAQPATPGQAQGVYSGTTANGNTFQTIILPNDRYYAIYGTTTVNAFQISGMMTGQGISNNGNYSATVTDFSDNSAIYTGSVSASYVVGSSIGGTVTETGNPTLTFTGTVMPSSQFNYNAPASLSNITGTWTGTLLDGTTATVTINTDGTFNGSSSGCSFSGTMAADISGKNFFDISLTYGASPCLLPNQTSSGIAVDYLLPDGLTRQLLAGVASGTTYGTVFVGQ